MLYTYLVEIMETVKVTEDPAAIERYSRIKAIGKTIFANDENLAGREIAEEDVLRAREFLAQAAQVSNPPVRATYWDHVIIAPELGKRLAEQATEKGLIENPYEVEFDLYLHDMGRLVTPAAYFRNDLIGKRLLIEVGVSPEKVKQLSSLSKLLEVADQLDFSQDQLRFESPLNEEQAAKVKEYFDSLTPAQRIVNLADNLGKRGNNGLFTLALFKDYLSSQEQRYDTQDSPWASIHWSLPRRRQSAVLQWYTVSKTVTWLEENGIDLRNIMEDLKEYGPSFEILVRHGNTTLPESGLTYNRDDSTDEKTKVDLDPIEGVQQLEEEGTIMTQLGYVPTRIIASPQSRSLKSAQTLGRSLTPQVNAEDIVIDPNINESYAPGPFKEEIKLDDWRKMTGERADVFSPYWITKWGHETKEALLARFGEAIEQYYKTLAVGESVALVSHDTPIVTWYEKILNETHHLLTWDQLQEFLRARNDKFVLGKGSSLVLVRDPKGRIFTAYLLPKPSISSTQ